MESLKSVMKIEYFDRTNPLISIHSTCTVVNKAEYLQQGQQWTEQIKYHVKCSLVTYTQIIVTYLLYFIRCYYRIMLEGDKGDVVTITAECK